MEKDEIRSAGGFGLYFVSHEIRFVSDEILNCVGFRGIMSTRTPNAVMPEEHL